jgi:hypothetical protein
MSTEKRQRILKPERKTKKCINVSPSKNPADMSTETLKAKKGME